MNNPFAFAPMTGPAIEVMARLHREPEPDPIMNPSAPPDSALFALIAEARAAHDHSEAISYIASETNGGDPGFNAAWEAAYQAAEPVRLLCRQVTDMQATTLAGVTAKLELSALVDPIGDVDAVGMSGVAFRDSVLRDLRTMAVVEKLLGAGE